jgi:inosine-uridine nucleoside N-ribohydrolase
VVPVPVALDTDIGGDIDDVLAVAFCALHPGIDLRCVTTVNGDTGRRARLARALLDLLGRQDVPVGAGASVGLSGAGNASMPAALNHGADLVDATTFAAEPAAAVLTDVMERASRPVQMCAVGAVTNVAATLAARPDLLDRVAGLHVMGGCLGPVRYGADDQEDDPFREYNLGCDPLAAAGVWALPLPLRLVPVDATMPLVLTDDDRAAIAGAGSVGRVLDALTEEYLAAARAAGGQAAQRAAVRLHDPLTVVGLVAPEVEVVKMRHLAVVGSPGRVATVESMHGRPVTACRRADASLLRRVLVDTLRGG